MSRHDDGARASAVLLVCALVAFRAADVQAANTDLRAIKARVYRSVANDPNTITLNGSKVVPPSGSPASGAAEVTGNNPLTQLSFNITHNVAGETSAAIRGPGYANENAAVLFSLPLGPHKVGTWSMTPTQADYLLAGQTYIQINSAAFPSGAIRGQLQAVNPPVAGKPIWIRVLIQNLGPDTYIGTEPNMMEPGSAWRHMAPNAAGRLKISVDIDEPTKPSLPGSYLGLFNWQKDFAVTLAAMDTIELDLGQVIGLPSPGVGTLTTMSSAIAQSPNIDPNPSNNTVTDATQVQPDTGPLSPVPVAGRTALLVLSVLLVSGAGLAIRHRAHSTRTSGGQA